MPEYLLLLFDHHANWHIYFYAFSSSSFCGAGCAASLVVVSGTFVSDNPVSKIVTVVALATYLAFFSAGLGPGNWVVVSEVFATSIRAKAMSVAVVPNRIVSTIMSSTFLSAAHAMTWPGFFLFLAGICLAGALFLYIYLPETKGHSLEDMSRYFAEITGDRSILDLEECMKREKLNMDAGHGVDNDGHGSTGSSSDSGMELT